MTEAQRRFSKTPERRAYVKKWVSEHPEGTRAASRRWRERHPQRAREVQQEHLKKKYAFLAWLKSLPCMDCSRCFPPECMDFDHRDPAQKEAGFGAGLWRKSLEAWQKELIKCDLVCANCHRTRTRRRLH